MFDAPNELELARLILEVEAPRTSHAAHQAIPQALDDLVARCLAKAPDARPQQVEELIAVFAPLLRAHPWTQESAVRWWQDFRALKEARAA